MIYNLAPKKKKKKKFCARPIQPKILKNIKPTKPHRITQQSTVLKKDKNHTKLRRK